MVLVIGFSTLACADQSNTSTDAAVDRGPPQECCTINSGNAQYGDYVSCLCGPTPVDDAGVVCFVSSTAPYCGISCRASTGQTVSLGGTSSGYCDECGATGSACCKNFSMGVRRKDVAVCNSPTAACSIYGRCEEQSVDSGTD